MLVYAQLPDDEDAWTLQELFSTRDLILNLWGRDAAIAFDLAVFQQQMSRYNKYAKILQHVLKENS